MTGMANTPETWAEHHELVRLIGKATSTPVRIRRRPLYTDAMLVTPESLDAVAEWCGGKVIDAPGKEETGAKVIYFRTANGPVWASCGDWVVRDTISDTFYPVPAEIFQHNYVLVSRDFPNGVSIQ
jgi:hypothetical protein